jgi:putative transcriptional regulator
MTPHSKYLSFLLLLANEAHITAFAPSSSKRHSMNMNTITTPSSSSQLQLSKNNDRARMEKSWEHMMGEDWREFRAKLVAQEHADEMMVASPNKTKQPQTSSSGGSNNGGGNFLAGAISSIFSKGDTKEGEGGGATTPTKNIFNGDAVGGATKYSKIPSACDDPFLSVEECHIMYDEPDVKIDKHRWAHPMYHLEPGCILVANEKLGGVFHQTVVLIIDHNENTGSTGMVINR